MKDVRIASSFAVVLFVCGCGGGGSSVTGTVGGHALAAQDAVFSAGGPSTTGSVLVISSYAGLCDSITAPHFPHGSSVLQFQLVDGGATVSSPGTFVLLGSDPMATKVFGASFSSVDAACAETSASATAGTITVTSVSATTVDGTFDLTFGTDHVTGSFSAASCPALGAATTRSTCM